MENKCECKDCGRSGDILAFYQGPAENCICPECGSERIRFFYFDVEGYKNREIREAYVWWSKLPNYERGKIKCKYICDEYFGNK